MFFSKILWNLLNVPVCISIKCRCRYLLINFTWNMTWCQFRFLLNIFKKDDPYSVTCTVNYFNTSLALQIWRNTICFPRMWNYKIVGVLRLSRSLRGMKKCGRENLQCKNCFSKCIFLLPANGVVAGSGDGCQDISHQCGTHAILNWDFVQVLGTDGEIVVHQKLLASKVQII